MSKMRACIVSIALIGAATVPTVNSAKADQVGHASWDLVLLADASLVLEPDLYLGACRLAARDLRQQVGEVFLKASAVCSLWA